MVAERVVYQSRGFQKNWVSIWGKWNVHRRSPCAAPIVMFSEVRITTYTVFDICWGGSVMQPQEWGWIALYTLAISMYDCFGVLTSALLCAL